MWLYIILAILSGLMFPTQSAVNGLLREEVGNPFLSGAISNLVGALIMAILALNTSKTYPLSLPVLTQNNWFILLGGIFSALIVISNIISPPKIGFVTFMAIFLIFQLIGSTLIDYFGLFQTQQRDITWETVVGLIFMIVGIIFIFKNRK